MKQILKIAASLTLITLTATALYMLAGVSPILTAGFLFLAGVAKYFITPSQNMDNSLAYEGFVVSDTTYAGEAAANFITKAITTNQMVEGGHIYVKDGIKKKFTIPRWDMTYTDLIQDRAATPTPKGNQTIDGKTITPSDFMLYHEFNPRDFEDHWYATQLPGSTLLDTTLPMSVESVIIQNVLKRLGKFFNEIIWKGDTTASTVFKYFDGLKTKATASSSTLKTGSTTTLTNSNIATEFLKGYALIPNALKYDPEMKYFVSYKTYDLFMQYQINQTYKGVDTTNIGVDKFRGLPVVKIDGLADDYYFIGKGKATPESNLWLGMNSNNDDNTIQLARLQANSELFFIKGLFKMDVQIGWNEETVTYE